MRRMDRKRVEPPNASVDQQSTAAGRAASAPRRQVRLPPTNLSKSGGKLRALVEEQPDNKRAKEFWKKRRKAELTEGDENYDNFSGSKDGPGRCSRGRHYPFTYSSSRHSSCGASTSSDDSWPVRI